MNFRYYSHDFIQNFVHKCKSHCKILNETQPNDPNENLCLSAYKVIYLFFSKSGLCFCSLVVKMNLVISSVSLKDSGVVTCRCPKNGDRRSSLLAVQSPGNTRKHWQVCHNKFYKESFQKMVCSVAYGKIVAIVSGYRQII